MATFFLDLLKTTIEPCQTINGIKFHRHPPSIPICHPETQKHQKKSRLKGAHGIINTDQELENIGLDTVPLTVSNPDNFSYIPSKDTKLFTIYDFKKEFEKMPLGYIINIPLYNDADHDLKGLMPQSLYGSSMEKIDIDKWVIKKDSKILETISELQILYQFTVSELDALFNTVLIPKYPNVSINNILYISPINPFVTDFFSIDKLLIPTKNLLNDAEAGTTFIIPASSGADAILLGKWIKQANGWWKNEQGHLFTSGSIVHDFHSSTVSTDNDFLTPIFNYLQSLKDIPPVKTDSQESQTLPIPLEIPLIVSFNAFNPKTKKE